MNIKEKVRSAGLSVIAASGIVAGAAKPAEAYQIDCAILLCLSGGWPASTECAAARAEFIRRITPWPIEPPLQIWRCPMGASFKVDPSTLTADRIYKILMEDTPPKQSFPGTPLAATHLPLQLAVYRHSGGEAERLPDDTLQIVKGFSGGNGIADIDISGSEFDFVRSIRVFHVPLAMQAKGDPRGCDRSGGSVRLGTYDTQGRFVQTVVSHADLPAAHAGMEGFGSNCPHVFHRSVFVDWRDYEGNYGFEQVNY